MTRRVLTSSTGYPPDLRRNLARLHPIVVVDHESPGITRILLVMADHRELYLRVAGSLTTDKGAAEKSKVLRISNEHETDFQHEAGRCCC
jgi:hypothetical protein